MLAGIMSILREVPKILLWILTVLLALWMVAAGLGKFQNAAEWQQWFVEDWGYPSWFRSFVGVAEIGGGILLLVPRIAPYAAAGLATIMLGALWTITTKPTDLSSVTPLIGAVLFCIVLAARWPWRSRPASVEEPSTQSHQELP
jgi:uncharacterized membrane protein YphA (DoxX/SURF4 family)